MPRLAASTASMTTGTGTPAANSAAAEIPAKETTAETERSNSPSTITSVAPIATMASSDICCVMLTRFETVPKACGEATAKTRTISASAKSVP